MDINNETLELLERRLGENVEKRVRGRLFAIYGAAATAFLSAFGYFGYDALTKANASMNTTVNQAQAAMKAKVDDFSEEARSLARQAVGPSVKDATDAAEKAEKVANDATIRLRFIDEWMSERTMKLAAIEDNVTTTLARVKTVTETIQQRLDEMNAKLGETEIQISGQQERAREIYAGAGNVDALKSDLATLTAQVAELEFQIQELNSVEVATTPEIVLDSLPRRNTGKVNPPPPPPEFVEGGKFQALATKYSELAVELDTAPALTTVYFQFAGVERRVAEAISAQLKDAGYEMPGEERTANAAGTHEVRYFFAEDEARAARLAADLNRGLHDAGYKANVDVIDFTGFKAAKPRLGTIELWLEPVRAS